VEKYVLHTVFLCKNIHFFCEAIKSFCRTTNPICEAKKTFCEATESFYEVAKNFCEAKKSFYEAINPICEDTKPICEAIKPICEDTKPICEDTKPICEDTKPICEDTKPFCEDTKPFCEAMQSFCGATKPFYGATKPIYEIANFFKKYNTLMKRKNIPIDLLMIENGIHGVLNTPEIQHKMDKFGYTQERISEGLNLLEEVKQMVSAHIEHYNSQYASTALLHEKCSEVYAIYMVTLKIVRIAFKGQPDILLRFKANGERQRSLSGWLSDANILYSNLLDMPAAIERMNYFGYSVERLQNEQRDVNEVENLHSLQLSTKGKAQQSTIERNKLLDELSDWYSDFRAIARIALYDTPQLLETLDIIKK
jgi:hypothetical protein